MLLQSFLKKKEVKEDFVPKPWMLQKEFILVTVHNIEECINACIASGYYSLDLETEGLDSRVFNGKTKHAVVGACLSPDGHRGYYIPLRHAPGGEPSPHNVPYSVYEENMLRLVNSKSVAIFHNGGFDQEFLQYNGSKPLGFWDTAKSWEDTMILTALWDSRRKKRGLKSLSKDLLKMEMIELIDLFPDQKLKKKKDRRLNYATLDPSRKDVLYYAASDAICTYLLYYYLKNRKKALALDHGKEESQDLIYAIEKMCITATRWMQRARIRTDRKIVSDLIHIGQKEYVDSLRDVYEQASKILGRDVMPLETYLMFEGIKKSNPNLEAYPPDDERSLKGIKARAKKKAAYIRKEVKKGSARVAFGRLKKYKDICERVAPEGERKVIGLPGVKVKYQAEYDVHSSQQLGVMFAEMRIPGMKKTDKGQIDTSKGFLIEAAEKYGERFPFLMKIKKFREIDKALGTYLYSLYKDACLLKYCHNCGSHFSSDTMTCPFCSSCDVEVDHAVKIKFNNFGTDTGRFSVRSGKGIDVDGVATIPLQGVPTGFDPKRPECMKRIREVFIARRGKVLFAIDLGGCELRIATNLSGEPLWIKEYFRCGDCGHEFKKEDEEGSAIRTPPFCPSCGSDRIGDLHTGTALILHGKNARETNPPKIWKRMRGDGKGSNFAVSYGGGPSAIVRAVQTKQLSFDDASNFIEMFRATYKGLAAWQDSMLEFARKYGYIVTAFNRKYPLPDIWDRDSKFRSKAERNAINGPMQACNADLTKMAMGFFYKECKKRGWVDLENPYKSKVNLLITMHDELVFEADEDIAKEAADLMVWCMVDNPIIESKKWEVPLVVDIEGGRDWSAEHNFREYEYGIKPWPKKYKEIFVKGCSAEEFFYTMSQPFTEDFLEKLIHAVQESVDAGGKVLKILSMDGGKIPLEGELRVDQDKFEGMMK